MSRLNKPALGVYRFWYHIKNGLDISKLILNTCTFSRKHCQREFWCPISYNARLSCRVQGGDISRIKDGDEETHASTSDNLCR